MKSHFHLSSKTRLLTNSMFRPSKRLTSPYFWFKFTSTSLPVKILEETDENSLSSVYTAQISPRIISRAPLFYLAGIYPYVGTPDSRQLALHQKTVQVRDSLLVGHSGLQSCSDALQASSAVGLEKYGGIYSPAGGHIGIVSPQFLSSLGNILTTNFVDWSSEFSLGGGSFIFSKLRVTKPAIDFDFLQSSTTNLQIGVYRHPLILFWMKSNY